MISILELIFDILFFAVCVATLIWNLLEEPKFSDLFLLQEYWSLLVQIIYYFLLILISIISLINKANRSGLQNLLKRSLFKFLFPFVTSSSVIFIFGHYFFWYDFNFNTINTDRIFFWRQMLLNFACQICFVIDAIMFSRELKKNGIFDILFQSGFYVLYAAFCFYFCSNTKYLFLYEDNWFAISTLVFGLMIFWFMMIFYEIIVEIRGCFGKNTKTTNDINVNGKLMDDMDQNESIN